MSTVYTLPHQLGTRPTHAVGVYSARENAFDYSIGNIPFLSGARDDIQIQRSTAPYEKDQFDTSQEPGEQSFTGWWLRSQSSFHLGAGILYEEPAQETTLRYRYRTSEGVNVWESGEVTLLRRTASAKATGSPVLVAGARDGSEDIFLQVEGASLFRVTESGSSELTWGGSGTILSLVQDGSNYYAADSSGVYTGPLSGDGSQEWDTGSGNVVLGWVKQRLMGGIGNAIYELEGDSGPTLPDPTYEHPNDNWQWTSFAEGPSAIYVSGYAGSKSTILSISLDTEGALPALTQATTAADLPTGETVHALHGYLDSFLLIGTNKGFRVGVFGQGGQLTYSGLTETPEPVRCFTGRGSIVYAGYSNAFSDGSSGLVGINMSTAEGAQRFPYAPDLQAHEPGAVSSVALFGTSGRLVFGIDNQGSYLEHDSELEQSGFLQTARVRHNTLYDKLFKRISIHTPMLNGPLSVSTIDDTETEVSLVTLNANSRLDQDISIDYPDRPQKHLALKFTLNRSDDDPTEGAMLSGYQLKSLPGGPKPRQLRIPLNCFDYEEDGNGVEVGYAGWGMERLLALEQLDSESDVVLFQDIQRNQADLVTIEKVEFIQMSPPGNNETWGGRILLTMRTVTA